MNQRTRKFFGMFLFVLATAFYFILIFAGAGAQTQGISIGFQLVAFLLWIAAGALIIRWMQRP